jgi:hypothetical protein
MKEAIFNTERTLRKLNGGRTLGTVHLGHAGNWSTYLPHDFINEESIIVAEDYLLPQIMFSSWLSHVVVCRSTFISYA